MTVSSAQPVQLRVSLVWHGEVMEDRLLTRPAKIRLGATKRATFVVPDLGLPRKFAIIRPGRRGYLLTLGARMRGTICLDGRERDVAEFVARGGEGGDATTGAAGQFRATPIGGRDWGVIALDPDGHHQLVFQFVPLDQPLPSAPLRWELMLPAIAFSILLHAILLAVTYRFDEHIHPFVYPGSQRLTGKFLVQRPVEEEPEKERFIPVKIGSPAAGAAAVKVARPQQAMKGDAGKAGGKGDAPRARDPDAREQPGPPPPQVDFLTAENKQTLEEVIQKDIRTSLAKFNALPGPRRLGPIGSGNGSGSGQGDDQGGTGATRNSKADGAGGGGSTDGDFTAQRAIDTGPSRKAGGGGGGGGGGVKEVGVVGTGTASGDLGGLTKDEIDKVVRSRMNLIRTCYQRELDRTRGLAGQVTIKFTIAADGTVSRAVVDNGRSTLRNDAVGDCVSRQIAKLKFPAKGGGFVNYPFNFSQGG